MSLTDIATPAAVSATDSSLRRRNRAEAAVRERLAAVDDVYVLSSSWHANGEGREPFVAIIARDADARASARERLDDIAGLETGEWSASWRPLSLGDWMLWVFPERARP